MTPTNTFEIGRHRPAGGVRTGCLPTIGVMEMSINGKLKKKKNLLYLNF